MSDVSKKSRFFSKRVGEEPGFKGSRGQGFEGQIIAISS